MESQAGTRNEVPIEMFSPFICKKIQFDAPADFAAFLRDEVAPFMEQPSVSSVLKKILAEASFLPGLIGEFGVFSGKTINMIAERFSDRTVWGFDSFEGFEEDWKITGAEIKVAKDVFHRRGTLPSVRENVQLVKGFFQNSLPGFLSQHPENFSMIHIDCDLYESTRVVLELCSDRIVPGTVIVFDEFLDYLHEGRAFFDFITAHGKRFQWLYHGGDSGILFDSAANKLFQKNLTFVEALRWKIMKPIASLLLRRKYLMGSVAVVMQ